MLYLIMKRNRHTEWLHIVLYSGTLKSAQVPKPWDVQNLTGRPALHSSYPGLKKIEEILCEIRYPMCILLCTRVISFSIVKFSCVFNIIGAGFQICLGFPVLW